MRLPGYVVFGAAAVLMARDFVMKLSPLYPWLAERPPGPKVVPLTPEAGK